jgi:hypothetical protein
MAGNNVSVELLRMFMHSIHKHSEWATSAEKRKAFADEIHSLIAKDVWEHIE